MSGISLWTRKSSVSNSSRRIAWLAGAIAGLLFAIPLARADAIKVRDLWIDNVQVEGVRGGTLTFRSPTGARASQPMSEIQGIRIDAHPELAEGQTQFDDDRFEQAARSFQKVVQDARPDWLQAYARARLVAAAAGANDAALAAETFAQLAQSAPDDALMPEPPVQVVRNAEQAMKAELERVLRRALGDVPRERREAVRSLIEALEQAPAEVADAGGAGTEPGAAGEVQGAVQSAMEGAVVLPTVLQEEDEVNRLLLAGRFEQAEALAREKLKTVGGTSRQLYQLGMALLGQAEETGDPDDYKTAALPFMRVIIHFHGGSRVTDYARAEAAYCHLRFGRADIAADLLNRARSGITEEDDPAYARRIDALMRELEETQN